MEQLTAEEFRAVELGVADEVHRICEERGLRYSLAYGTLLGAIRHKGFIPWDDDMDMYMLREDYDLLVDHFREWRSSSRFDIMASRIMNSPYTMAKVIDTRTYVKSIWDKERYSMGVWVDIIPVDRFEAENTKALRQIMHLKHLRPLAVSDPRAGHSPLRKLAKGIVCPVASQLLEPMAISRQIDGLARQQCRKSTATVASLVNMHGFVKPFPASWFDGLELFPFEDRRYYCPSNYDEVLTYEFGDWRTPIESLPHLEEAYWVE